MHAHQRRCSRCAAPAGEDGDVRSVIRGGCRPPRDFRSAASPFIEDVHQEPTGSTTRDVPKCTSWMDGCSWLPVAVASPVPRLRAKRGMAAAGDQHADACSGAEPVRDRVELEA